MMKRIPFLISLLCGVFIFTNAAFAFSIAEIKGKITDASTQEPLVGATIYISDLKAFTSSDAQGDFTLKNIPTKGKFLVEVRFIGYKSLSKMVDLSMKETFNFALEPTVMESPEIVITGTPFSANNKTNSLAVVTLGREKIAQAGGSNLIDAIAKIPGVTQITTGGAISKPSIRGLGYNRVLTIVDGAREEGQQWGDEHGIQVDQFGAARLEILKGPASLLYGSDALGGVINIIDDIVPANGDLNGNFTSNYNTNNGLIGSSLMLQGNTDGFVYRGRVSYKNAYGFGYGKNITVPNSGFNEANVSGMLGVNKTWGSAHLNLSRFSTNVGLVEDGPATDGFFRDETGQLLSKADARTRSIGLPFQHINHYRAALNSNILLGGGQLKSTFAFQKNIRQEFAESKDAPGLHLNLDSYTYDVKYAFANNGTWEPTIGVQGMYQTNSNNGEEFLIPDYSSNNIGFFAYVKRNFSKGAINGGVRYDYKNIDGADLTANGQQVFKAFNNSFSNVSGSLGFAYQLTSQLTLKGNAGSGFRAPNIAELAANGRHEGTFRYEIGNSKLKQETSLQFDLGLEYAAEKITFGFNAYNNRIYNYIYPGSFNNETTPFTDEQGLTTILPVYRFVQTNANLIGAEASVDFHLIKALHFENTFGYVKGTNITTSTPLSFIPSASLTNELRFEPTFKGLSDTFIKVGLTNVFRQNRVDFFETQTDGYSLLDAGFGTALKLKNKKINIWASGQNLTNKLYVNHLNRYKQVGIFNPGRNLSFGFSLPL